MSQTLRHPEILRLARQEGQVSVEALATRFGVTLQTIRRDLAELAEAGRLERVHGGAVLPSGAVNMGYEERRAINREAKEAIGRACAAAIPEKASVFLNIGTSTEAVARALLHHRGLLVGTNNLNVAGILAGSPDCRIMVTGGSLRRSDGGLLGGLAVSTTRRFKFDFAVIGCSAVDAEGDLLDFDIEEVEVSQAIMEQSRKVLLVADHSKFQRPAPARIASLSEIGTVFTDRPLPRPLGTRCLEWDTRVVVTR